MRARPSHSRRTSTPAAPSARAFPWRAVLACTQIGLSPAEALAACTVNAAHVLGRADRVGRIAPGYDADVVLLERTRLALRRLPPRHGSRRRRREGGGAGVAMTPKGPAPSKVPGRAPLAPRRRHNRPMPSESSGAGARSSSATSTSTWSRPTRARRFSSRRGAVEAATPSAEARAASRRRTVGPAGPSDPEASIVRARRSSAVRSSCRCSSSSLYITAPSLTTAQKIFNAALLHHDLPPFQLPGGPGRLPHAHAPAPAPANRAAAARRPDRSPR